MVVGFTVVVVGFLSGPQKSTLTISEGRRRSPERSSLLNQPEVCAGSYHEVFDPGLPFTVSAVIGRVEDHWPPSELAREMVTMPSLPFGFWNL